MTNSPENTGQKQVRRKQDGTFKRGVSGNISGRPRGSRNKATLAALNLLCGESEALTRKAIELAMDGDVTALRLCLERIAPALKSVAPPIEMTAPLPDTLTDQAKSFIKAASTGKISPDTAAQLVSTLSSAARIEEVETLKHRLDALERTLKDQKP